MKNLKLFVLSVLGIGLLATALASTSVGAQSNDPATGAPTVTCNQYFLTFPAWYRGLVDGNCEVLSPTKTGDGELSTFIWKIVLNVVEMLLNAVGYLSVAYIIYGGYKYMISAGSPDGMVGARKTILNAVIGLTISVAAVAIVRTITIAMGQG